MRVLLVGPRPDRARLRRELNGALDIVGEFDTLGAAHASAIDHEAIMIAGAARTLEREETIDDPLTPREIQVLELLAEGLSNKSIAARLGISDQTVKFHVAARRRQSHGRGAASGSSRARRLVRPSRRPCRLRRETQTPVSACSALVRRRRTTAST
jgi:hypothetical protein